MSDLFPESPRFAITPRPAGAPRGQQPLRPRLVAETDCWTVEDHVCRDCMGRIMSRPGEHGRVFQCACCGKSEVGAGRTSQGRLHPKFCACSIKYGFKDAGIRCEVNEAPSPEVPVQIVARQVE